MRNFFIYNCIAALFLLGVACGKIKKTDAEVEREQWIEGFSDSIEYYKLRSAQIDTQLEKINSQISSMLENFELIKNPREVSGYYLLRGWNKKIPMTSTGIYARINENEKLELIATLAGNTFNKIAVGSDQPEFYSEIVPHDQAFNFRHDRFNTVYFAGGKADTIAEFISTHHQERLKIEFIDGNKIKNFKIPDDEKDMISKTWNLYEAKHEALKLQKELWICSKKIDTFRRIMDEENQRKIKY